MMNACCQARLKPKHKIRVFGICILWNSYNDSHMAHWWLKNLKSEVIYQISDSKALLFIARGHALTISFLGSYPISPTNVGVLNRLCRQ